MPVTLDNAKRTALGSKLADIKALQNLLIANEQKFLSEIKDQDIRDRMQDMLNDDQKNLGILKYPLSLFGSSTFLGCHKCLRDSIFLLTDRQLYK